MVAAAGAVVVEVLVGVLKEGAIKGPSAKTNDAGKPRSRGQCLAAVLA